MKSVKNSIRKLWPGGIFGKLQFVALFIFRLFSIAEQMCIVEANSVECCFRFLNFLLCNEVDYGVWIAPETLFIQVSVKLTINPACPSKLY